MHEFSPNYEKDSLTAFHRLFADLNLVTTAADSIFAFEKFYEAVMRSDTTNDTRFDPPDSLYETLTVSYDSDVPDELRLTKERLMNYAVTEMGPLLEATHTPEDMQVVYTEAIAYMLDSTEGPHSQKCLTVHYTSDPACSVSGTCPRRLIARYCSDDILTQIDMSIEDREDSYDIEYQFDCIDRYDMVKARVLAAKQAGLLPDLYVDMILDHYDHYFNRTFVADKGEGVHD